MNAAEPAIQVGFAATAAAHQVRAVDEHLRFTGGFIVKTRRGYILSATGFVGIGACLQSTRKRPKPFRMAIQTNISGSRDVGGIALFFL